MYISRVAELNTDGSFDAVGEIERLPIDLEELVMSDMESAVETLGIYIGLNDIAPLCAGATDEEGKIEFNALKPGLYLVCGEDFVFDGYTYSVDPVLLFTPSYDNSTGEWIYETVMAPKFEGEPEIPVDETVERKVLKIWNDGGKAAERPASIRVYLLRNDEIFDTVILSQGNNWRYTWSELDADYDWTVAEAVPEGYTVSVSREGITFALTNSTENPPPTTPPPSTPPELPQTGQLWWPVPVLAILGMILFLIGYICSSRGNGEE